MLGVMVGMRQGEALGLSWQDVDLDKGIVQVRQALQYRSGERLAAGSAQDAPVAADGASRQTASSRR